MNTTQQMPLDGLRPIREGLMQLQPPRLLGSQCDECGTVAFPARDFCPACTAQAEPRVTPLSPNGTIYSYTTVYQAPAGRKTPYSLAYVDLEDGVRVLAQVDLDPGQLAIGKRVRLDLRPVEGADNEALLSYAFVSQDNVKE